MEFKQAIVVRADLGMGRGKMVAQGSHASVDAFRKAPPEVQEEWDGSGSKKITLKVGSEKELLDVFMAAKAAKLPASLVKDAGHTQVEPGTPTAVAIGPAGEKEIDKITGGLKLL